jgi:hypothetical protein
MAATPAALQLRLLQTMVEVAAEKNSTLVLPFPVELLRYFEAVATDLSNPARDQATDATPDVVEPPSPPAVREAQDASSS